MVSDFMLQCVRCSSTLDSVQEVIILNLWDVKSLFLSEMSVPGCGVSVLFRDYFLIVMSVLFGVCFQNYLWECVTRYGISFLVVGLYPEVCDL